MTYIPMKKFSHSHPNVITGTLALVLSVILVAFYFWGINDMVIQLHRALIAPSPQSAAGFDLSAAAKLDLRGLVNGVPAPTPTPVAPTTTTTAATATTTAPAR